MNTSEWKKDYEEFEKVTRQFYAGDIPGPQYKGFSGGFGSYAQKGGKASMLRLRMPGGRVTKKKLDFVVNAIKKHDINKIHFTTCQTIQLHNLSEDTVCELAVEALDYGIVTRGGGGDFPRNVMVSPLSGLEKGEYFDVTPYAEAAAEYLMGFIKTVKLPRKLKVCFSNSPANLTHATFRDLGFVAREDGKFDVYSAGGLGNNPKMGVKVAEAVEGSKILYYIKAMVKLFTTYGNYENRAKARTRYMQDVLGDKYVDEFQKMLELAQEEDLDIAVKATEVTKNGDDVCIEDPRVIAQKQDGLYAVLYHPIGGCPSVEKFVEIANLIADMEQVELRLTPDEAVYIVNCTGSEAKRVLEITGDGSTNLFESSIACIGGTICQTGVRDSQKVLKDLVVASKEWNYDDGVLPQIHISGCPSSCGTHQIGRIGFRGGVKKVDGKPQSAFVLYVNGLEGQKNAKFGEMIGTILETEIPNFMRDLGKVIQESGMKFDEWYAENTDKFKEIAAPYVKE
ncbi:MAG: nitrite/sulfite reductase [Dorea sp.]